MATVPRTLLDAVQKWASETPAAPALLAPGRLPCSYAGLRDQVDRTADRLTGIGIGPSDAVAVVLPNGPDMAVAFVAVTSAAVCAPLNPSYTESELGFYLDDLRARAVIVSPDAAAAIRAATARQLPVIQLRTAPAEPAGTFELDGLPIEQGRSAAEARLEGVALVLHTSGTTSRPKQVPLSHRNLLTSARNVAETLRLERDDRCLNVMPLFHIHGLVAALAASLSAGASVVCPPAFDPDRFFEWIDEFAPSWYTAVPTIHQAALAAARRRAVDGRPGTLRFVRSSSAALPPSVMAALEATFGAPVIEAYGMTEAAHQMASNPLPPAPRKPGTVGIAAGPEIAVVDGSQRFLAAGETGEIVIRGSNVTAGYVANADANAEAFFDGWFRTGDEGLLDDDGYLTITGRLKEIINRGGEKVAPREVEERLLTHEAVAHAVVFAAPHPTLGEDVAAAVVLAPGRNATLAELRDHVAAGLAPFKVPRQILVLDALPVGPTGKLQRIGMAERLGIGGSAEHADADAVTDVSPLEQAVRDIWATMLGVDHVGLDDDFFVLGGDSLSAIELVARVLHALDVEVPVSAIFDEAATVRSMVTVIERLMESSATPIAIVRDSANDASVSFAEERLWFLHALDPVSVAYHVPLALELRGPLDAPALENALDELVRRHDRLRTTFATVDGKPEAVVLPPSPVPIPIDDLRDHDEPRATALRLASKFARVPFDVNRGPLLRVALYRTDDEAHVLLIVCHHIVTDARSRRIMRDELATLYTAFSAGASSPLGELPLRYADLAAWQRARVASSAGSDDLAYWRDRLSDPPPPLELPSDRLRTAMQPTEGAALRVELSGELRSRLVELAEARRATLFMVLLAGFATLLHRLTGRTDITVGAPVSGRTRTEADPIVGLFVNTVVIRVAIEPDTPFDEVLARVREACLGAYDHQAMPFERLVEELRPARDTAHTPLVQTFFHLRNPVLDHDSSGALTIEELEIHAGGAKFELSIDVSDLRDSLSAHIEYPTALFDEATIRRIGERFDLLLRDAVTHPTRPVGNLRAALDDEVATVDAWSRGAQVAVPDVSLHELIAMHANTAPDETAIVDGDVVMTRRDLDRASNRFAHHLIELGVGRGDRVAVCLPRCVDAVVAELGVMKAGAAFAPVDPTYPMPRLAEMLEDLVPAAVVAARFIELPTEMPKAAVVLVDADRTVIAARSVEPPAVHVGADDPAWVLFTSGSTGRAKGVVGRHRTEVNRATWRAAEFPPRRGEVHAHRVAPGFVDMIIEVFGALAAGLTVAVVPEDDAIDPWRLVDLLARHHVTRVIVSPSHLRSLLDAVPDLGERLPDLWLWNISGEAIPADLARRFFAAAPDRVFLNTYGSTEAPNATFAALREPPATAWDVPSGRPVANAVVKVADVEGRAAPIGVTGEVWVGGAPTAIGYLDDPELTSARFVDDPDVAGGRWYRSGDLGTWLSDGTLRHLGRIDRQVKVRGMRVELTEIEAVLADHPSVLEAAVIAVDGPFGARLVAYVRGERGLDLDDITSYLRHRVPRHAVPTAIVAVDDVPRTTSGKLDRALLARLPLPPTATDERRQLGQRERLMAEVWSAILERDVASIGVDDDFFDIGGHSLLAIELLIRIEDTFDRRLPLRQLFDTPTLGSLVASIDSASVDRLGRADRAVRLAPGAPDRIPVFCVAGIGSTILGWRRAAARLDDRIPLFGVEAAAFGPHQRPPKRIEVLAARHLELIDATVGDGPLVLCGHSFGGLVAYEMARQLAARGQTVAGLVLVDTKASRKIGHRRLTPRTLPRTVVGGVKRRAKTARRAVELTARSVGLVKARSGVDRHRWVKESNRAAMEAWTPGPYDGSIVLLAIENWRLALEPTLGWDSLASSVEVIHVPGVHEHLLAEQWVQSTASALDECLLRLTARDTQGRD